MALSNTVAIFVCGHLTLPLSFDCMLPGTVPFLAVEQTDLTALNAIATFYIAQVLATCSDAQRD